MTPRLVRAVLTSVILVSGCPLPDPGSRAFECEADDQCATGWTCSPVSRQCRQVCSDMKACPDGAGLTCVAGRCEEPGNLSSSGPTSQGSGSSSSSRMSSGGGSSGSGSSSTSLGPPPAALAWRGVPTGLDAGRCDPVDLALLDANGGPASAPSPLSVQLRVTTSDLLSIHTDNACQTAAIQVRVIPGGMGGARLYLRGARAGTAVVEALAPPLTSASFTLPVAAATPNAVTLTGPKVTVAQTECSAPLLLGLKDALGNAVAPQQATDITLTSNSPGLTFYTDATCGVAAPGGVVRLPAGVSSVQARMNGSTVGTFSVTATAGALAVATQQHEIIALSAPHLVLSGLPGTVDAGACSPLTVERQQNSTEYRPNTAARVNLSTVGAVDATFHGDAACSGAAARTVDIPANSGRATIYVRGTRAGTLVVTASFPSYADGVLPLIIQAAAPARLALPAVLTLTAGACTSNVKLTLVDAFGNPTTTSTMDTNINLTSGGTGLSVSGGNGCAAAQTVVIFAGRSETDISLRSTTVGTYNFGARAAGLQDAASTAVVLPAAATVLAVNLPGAVAAGGCSGVLTAELQDNFGNLSPAVQSLPVTFTATGPATITFHQEGDAACASASAPVEVAAQQARLRFRLRGGTAGMASVTVGVGTLQASRMVTVSAGAPARLVGPAMPVALAAGDCVPVPLQVLDAQNNPSPAAADTSITLQGPATGPTLHADSGCMTNVAPLLPAGVNTVTVYVQARSGGVFNVNLQSDFPEVPLTVQVTGAVRRVTCAMMQGQDTVDCDITPPVTNVGRSFFFFQATHDAADAAQGSVRCRMNGPAQLRCVRENAGVPVAVAAQVVEIPRGTSVQHVNTGCTGQVTPIQLNPAVDPAHSFVLWSASGAGAAFDGADMATAVLRANGTAVELTATASCNNNRTYSVQVVSAPWAQVDRGAVQLAPGALSVDVTVPSQDPTTSFVLHGWRHNGAGATVCDRMVRGSVESATQLTFSRGVEQGFTCTSPDVTVAYERVTLLDQSHTQQVRVLLFPSVPSGEEALPLAVDATRAVVFSGGQWSNGQATGEGSYDASQVPGMMLGRMSLTNGTSVNVERGGLLGAAAWSVTVWELGL